MDLILIIGGTVFAILGAALAKILADDFKAWRPKLVEYLVARAVAKLPESYRDRLGEEWRSHVDEIPGEIAKIIVALGYRWAAVEIRTQLIYGRGLKFAVTKRAQDVAVAGAALLFLSALAVIISFAIKLESRGPILFRQQRLGLNGQAIYLYKFRTMRCLPTTAPEEGEQIPTPRLEVTRVGRFLRAARLDEVPQVWNVLRGDMSIVGPVARPITTPQESDSGNDIDSHSQSHNMKPGLTGWAQLNAGRHSTEAERQLQRLRDDAYYTNNWSLWLDLKILWRTVVKTFKDIFFGH